MHQTVSVPEQNGAGRSHQLAVFLRCSSPHSGHKQPITTKEINYLTELLEKNLKIEVSRLGFPSLSM